MSSQLPGYFYDPSSAHQPRAQDEFQPPQPGYAPPPGYSQPGQYPPPAQYGQQYPSIGQFNQQYPPTGQFGQYPQPPPGNPPQNGYSQPVITSPPQPTGFQQDQNPQEWMPIPYGAPNCPPGLEYLLSIDQLLIHQRMEFIEAFTGFETSNKYEIKNSMGQKVYMAHEDNDCCTRNCCGPIRPFDMKITDNAGTEVVHFYRPLRCDCCCCPCFLQRMEVMAPPGNLIGYVEQEWSILVPKYKILNAAGDTVLRIEGPMCTWSICGDVEFKILSADKTNEFGKITKQWAGILKEAFTDVDNFGITFPMDLDVNIKAVLVGACFLIDFMFFEKKGNKENDGPGML